MILRRTTTFEFAAVKVRGLRIARVRKLTACGPRDAEEHARELAGAGGPVTVVDLRTLGRLESAQIGWMIAVDGCARMSGRRVAWLLHSCMRATLGLLCLERILSATYSEEDAAASLS